MYNIINYPIAALAKHIKLQCGVLSVFMADKFDWELHPELDSFVQEKVSGFLERNSFARGLSSRMLDSTSTRFIDWIDHIVLPAGTDPKSLAALGLSEIRGVEKAEGTKVFRHMDSYLFPILIGNGNVTEIAIKPESLDDLSKALKANLKIDGNLLAPLRKAVINSDGDTILSAVERRGYDGFIVKDSVDNKEYAAALEAFRSRKRDFDTDKEGMDYTENLIKGTLDRLGNGRVSDAFFRAEREYWESRNSAGRVQKARQDSLGLGWGNHDHHTYRSSRENFNRMIRIFETMGYGCREKYYAGEKAGWGAQILEHPVCNIVVFTDVDLNQDETSIDFAHVPFSEKESKLGTVGLWVGLHGESILQAGMHHLEARFVFDRLGKDLEPLGVPIMPPFSYFDFLKQAFTKGEMWKVSRRRLDVLLESGYITKEQYDQFLSGGALGSHMENLERDQGFKGFNRSSVTKIILETDPRKHQFTGA